jgi:hypothetical protein
MAVSSFFNPLIVLARAPHNRIYSILFNSYGFTANLKYGKRYIRITGD